MLSIVETTIDMCQNLGFTVVAEALKPKKVVGSSGPKWRCDVVQGYHYGKPLPFTGIKDLAGSPPHPENCFISTAPLNDL